MESTQTTPITDVAALVDGYIAAWNATDPARRRELVGLVFSDDASYVDPLLQGDGADAIDAMIAGAQAQFPGHRFELAGAPDHHHDRVRFSWRLRGDNGEGEPVAIGHDFATVAGDGRMRTVTGFLEQP
jgi:SnoaL-like domain